MPLTWFRLALAVTVALAAYAAPLAAPSRASHVAHSAPLATPGGERPDRPLVTRTPTAANGAVPVAQTLSLTLVSTLDAPLAHDLAWFPDGQRLAVAGAHGVFVYDASTLAEQQFFDLGAYAYRLGISPDGR